METVLLETGKTKTRGGSRRTGSSSGLPDSLTEVGYQYLFLGCKTLNIVPPELKHLAPLFRVFRAVVDAPHSFYLVIECLLNYVGAEAFFM